VKSKEIVDDVASDDDSHKDNTVGTGASENSAVDGKRKRQSRKTKQGSADGDGKQHRKRQTKNKKKV